MKGYFTVGCAKMATSDRVLTLLDNNGVVWRSLDSKFDRDEFPKMVAETGLIGKELHGNLKTHSAEFVPLKDREGFEPPTPYYYEIVIPADSIPLYMEELKRKEELCQTQFTPTAR